MNYKIEEWLSDYFKHWYKVCLEDTSNEGRIQTNTISEIMNHLGIKYEVDVR